MTWLRLLPLLALALALVAAAPVLPGVGAGDRRATVDAGAPPWRALARLQVPGESRCTAVLIGRRTALTAAHCLWSRRLAHLMPPGSVHVLTRYAAGRFARHSRAVTYWVAPGYTPSAPDALAQDVAVVTLADAIGDDVLPLADADPVAGTPLVLGGYNQDRAEVIEADLHCRIVGAPRGRGLQHDCAATHGTSGAPLLAQAPDGAWRIVGLQLAAAAGRPGGVALAPFALRQAVAAAGAAGQDGGRAAGATP